MNKDKVTDAILTSSASTCTEVHCSFFFYNITNHTILKLEKIRVLQSSDMTQQRQSFYNAFSRKYRFLCLMVSNRKTLIESKGHNSVDIIVRFLGRKNQTVFNRKFVCCFFALFIITLVLNELDKSIEKEI